MVVGGDLSRQRHKTINLKSPAQGNESAGKHGWQRKKHHHENRCTPQFFV